VIELGRGLPPLAPDVRVEANKVQGCASQVWLATHVETEAGSPTLRFEGDSDAHIVKGLVAILIHMYSGLPAREILSIDPDKTFEAIGLREHLTPQRSNGLKSMVERIRRDARTALVTAQASGAV
jgi:cysteine desulfuration protein SufE